MLAGHIQPTRGDSFQPTANAGRLYDSISPWPWPGPFHNTLIIAYPAWQLRFEIMALYLPSLSPSPP